MFACGTASSHLISKTLVVVAQVAWTGSFLVWLLKWTLTFDGCAPRRPRARRSPVQLDRMAAMEVVYRPWWISTYFDRFAQAISAAFSSSRSQPLVFPAITVLASWLCRGKFSNMIHNALKSWLATMGCRSNIKRNSRHFFACVCLRFARQCLVGSRMERPWASLHVKPYRGKLPGFFDSVNIKAFMDIKNFFDHKTIQVLYFQSVSHRPSAVHWILHVPDFIRPQGTMLRNRVAPCNP